MLKTSSLGLKAHRAADIARLFCCLWGQQQRSCRKARAEAWGSGSAVLPQGSCLDKWPEKFSGWKDASGQDVFSQGGNFLSA